MLLSSLINNKQAHQNITPLRFLDHCLKPWWYWSILSFSFCHSLRSTHCVAHTYGLRVLYRDKWLLNCVRVLETCISALIWNDIPHLRQLGWHRFKNYNMNPSSHRSFNFFDSNFDLN